ncbi:MAG: DUF6796 family protein [Bacillota bacterium]
MTRTSLSNNLGGVAIKYSTNKGEIMTNIIFSIIGIIGGLLCAIGDIFIDLKGRDNVESGAEPKFINSNWDKMSPWRFRLSILLATFGVPMTVLGGITLANIVAESSAFMGNFLLIAVVVGGVGGFFIHASICLVPIIYLKARDLAGSDVAEKIVYHKWDAIKVPFMFMYLILIVVTSILVIVSICLQYLAVPMWCVILNPLVFLIIGVMLRLVCNKVFYELPGIIMPSMGLAMYGVLCIIALL